MTNDTPTIPSRYVIHYRFVQCEHCGHATRESQFLALTYVRTRMGTGLVRDLKQVPRPLYNLPVDKVLTGCHKVPFCQACDSVSLSHLPPPPSEAALHDLPEPALKTAAKAKPTTPPRRKPTIEELA